MTAAQIPFANSQESGWDELGGASPSAMNVIVDGKGVVRKRPGIVASPLATSDVIDASGLDGIYVTNGGTVFVVGGGGGERPIYRVTASAAGALSGGVSPYGLRGSDRPVFAETEMLVVIAGGREIQKIDLALMTSDRLGGTPPIASHVVANNLRLLANDIQVDKTKVRYSDVAIGETTYAGNEDWALAGVGTSGYFTAEANPDAVVALGQTTGEVVVWGQTTSQVFAPDADLIYAPISTLELGMGAAYSAIKVDNDFMWLDPKRRFVKSDLRSFNVISAPIQKTLDSITTIDDCFGYRVTQGPLDAVVWTFPTDGRSFCFQLGAGWSQWMGWDGNWSRFIVNGLTQPLTQTNPLVCTTTGKVAELSLDAATDLGESVNAYITTGYLNRDTEQWKHCLKIRLAFRRGNTSSTPGPQAFVRWRDRPGAWEGLLPIDLGSSGDTEIVVEFPALGMYRRRQWMFEFTGSSALALVSATEEFEVSDV